MSTIDDKNLLSYEHLLDIIINTTYENKITPDKRNKNGKNLFQIIEDNKICDLEYYIKDLVIDFKIGNIEKNSLDDLINEIKDKNPDKGYINEKLLSFLKESVKKIQLAYNSQIKDNFYSEDSIPEYEIKKFTKQDIKNWAKSNHVKENINNKDNKEFLIEVLAITDRANELICHHRMREVQIIFILIILNSPEYRGLFA